jgi:uncharacterized membrane protein
MTGGGGFGGLFIFLFVALGITAIVLLIIWAVRVSGGHHVTGTTQLPPTDAADSHNEAVAVAKLRLAKGEITPEQYQEIMRVLGS